MVPPEKLESVAWKMPVVTEAPVSAETETPVRVVVRVPEEEMSSLLTPTRELEMALLESVSWVVVPVPPRLAMRPFSMPLKLACPMVAEPPGCTTTPPQALLEFTAPVSVTAPPLTPAMFNVPSTKISTRVATPLPTPSVAAMVTTAPG